MNRVSLLSLSTFLLFATAPSFAQFPKAVPDGPLGDADTAFLTEYVARTKSMLAENLPYIEVHGSELSLHHGGQPPDTERVVPTVYHALIA